MTTTAATTETTLVDKVWATCGRRAAKATANLFIALSEGRADTGYGYASHGTTSVVWDGEWVIRGFGFQVPIRDSEYHTVNVWLGRKLLGW